MATAYLNLVTLVRTTIILSVSKVSVWGTLAHKYRVAHVKGRFLVELECPAFMSQFGKDLMKVTLTMLPAISMMEKAALYLAVSAYLGIVLRVVTFVLPLTVHLAPISTVRHGCPVLPWKLGVLVTLATRHVCKVHKALVPVTTNAVLVIAITQLVNWTQEYAQSQVFALLSR
jgi:hypothetical protein